MRCSSRSQTHLPGSIRKSNGMHEATVMDATTPSLTPFDFAPRTRVVFGSGSLNRLGDLAELTERSRALLVTDEGIREAGHVDRALSALSASNLDVVVFDETNPNPTTVDVDRALCVAGRFRSMSLSVWAVAAVWIARKVSIFCYPTAGRCGTIGGSERRPSRCCR